ncbi:prohead core protein serine protease [Chryseobacterium phage MA9V-1]|nr:prohead core protein serine protease [Chryseobacterium phage MA9V-1]
MNNTQNLGFLVENHVSHNVFKRIDESVALPDGVLMLMRGTFIPMDVPGENGRWYTYADYAPQVEMLLPKIARKECFGEIEHPQRVHVPYDLASHRVEEVYYDKASNSWIGTIAILDTEKGRAVYDIAKTGAPIYVSHRALGSVDQKTGKGILLKLLTWDVTSNPSFKAAEFSRAELINESAYVYLPLEGEMLNECYAELGLTAEDFINESTVTLTQNELLAMLNEAANNANALATERYAKLLANAINVTDNFVNEHIAVQPSQVIDVVKKIKERPWMTAQEMLDPEFKFNDEYMHPLDLIAAMQALASEGMLYDEDAPGFDEKEPQVASIIAIPQLEDVIANWQMEQDALAADAIAAEEAKAAKYANESADFVNNFASEYAFVGPYEATKQAVAALTGKAICDLSESVEARISDIMVNAKPGNAEEIINALVDADLYANEALAAASDPSKNKQMLQILVNFTKYVELKLHVFHHNTKSFSQHKAFDTAYKSFQKLTDSIIEQAMGYSGERYDSIDLSVSMPIVYADDSGADVIESLYSLSKVIKLISEDWIAGGLSTLSDDVSGIAAQLSYLMTLNESKLDEFANEGVASWLKDKWSRLKRWANSNMDATVTIDGVDYVIDDIQEDDKVICRDSDGRAKEFTFDEVYKYLNENNILQPQTMANTHINEGVDEAKANVLAILSGAKFVSSADSATDYDFSIEDDGIIAASDEVALDILTVLKNNAVTASVDGAKVNITFGIVPAVVTDQINESLEDFCQKMLTYANESGVAEHIINAATAIQNINCVTNINESYVTYCEQILEFANESGVASDIANANALLQGALSVKFANEADETAAIVSDATIAGDVAVDDVNARYAVGCTFSVDSQNFIVAEFDGTNVVTTTGETFTVAELKKEDDAPIPGTDDALEPGAAVEGDNDVDMTVTHVGTIGSIAINESAYSKTNKPKIGDKVTFIMDNPDGPGFGGIKNGKKVTATVSDFGDWEGDGYSLDVVLTGVSEEYSVYTTELINESATKPKVGDKVKGSKDLTAGKIGTVTELGMNQATVDFGNGNAYGISYERFGNEFTFVNESLKYKVEDFISDVTYRDGVGYIDFGSEVKFSGSGKTLTVTIADDVNKNKIVKAMDAYIKQNGGKSNGLVYTLNEAAEDLTDLPSGTAENIDHKVIEDGNETNIPNNLDKPLENKLAEDFLARADKAVTFEQWIVDQAASNDLVTPQLVMTVKTIISDMEVKQMINESAVLTAAFINESAEATEQSKHLKLIGDHIGQSHKYMFEHLNESAKGVLVAQAELYNLSSQNIHDFLDTRNWAQIANTTINESVAQISANIQQNDWKAALKASFRAGRYQTI